MGYQSDVRSFNTRYIYTDNNQRKNWHNATGSTVIAAHEGQSRQQIIIMAHLDTYAPQSDKDVENNLGGLTLQGIYGRKMDNWHQMSYMVQGGLDLMPVITHRFHYTDFQKGFDAMMSGRSGKVVLDWTK